jgi:DNA-binding response OmpR family regulator
MADKIKVLMVDDEEQFRATTSKILNRKGFTTTLAGTGEEALAILKKSPQDVVVLDVRMPGMDGHQTLAEIRKIDAKLPVIMLTGHGEAESAKVSFKEGAFDYLSKPCDIDLLAARIQDACSLSTERVQEEKRVRDIMIPVEDYTTIDVNRTLKEAIAELKKSHETILSTGKIMETGHRSILVFDEKGELVGILSIKDLIRALRPAYLSTPMPTMADSIRFSPLFWRGLFTHQVKALIDKKVGNIMSKKPLLVDENANLMEVADLMFTERARRVAVTRQEKVVGIVREQELFFEIARIVHES